MEGVTIEIQDGTLYVAVEGKLDTMRAMSLDEKLNEITEDFINLCFDFAGLTYIASAGLRILYWAQEYIEESEGTLLVKNVGPEVYEIFDMTGFAQVINIERG